ncbi:MAG: hypothetical protein HC772_03580 [Leptolyngbyaceae cyanobacterium CRU_2_3]|nr:hypothetical protein [Leptolyngbyaceae cyanobacterium CRU_2_3]
MTIHLPTFTHCWQPVRQLSLSVYYGGRLVRHMPQSDRDKGIAKWRIFEWGIGYSDRLLYRLLHVCLSSQVAQALSTDTLRWLASFDRWDHGVDLPWAGYQLAESHLRPGSGRYGLAAPL